TTAMVVAGASAFALLKNRAIAEGRTAIRMAILMMAIVAPLQVLVGHESGLVAIEHQSAKVAAMEGWWETRADQPTVLIAWPDETRERNLFELKIPGTSSIVFGNTAEEELAGLSSYPNSERP